MENAIRTNDDTGSDAPFDAAASARSVLRAAATGSLGTLKEDGHPFTSLVTTATTGAGEPVMLLSDLAVHTANLKRDPRASLLLVGAGGETGDPLAGARLTVLGTVEKDEDEASARRFLARHVEAQGYASFADFSFYRLRVESAHLVAGFGRIETIAADDLLADVPAALADGEAGAVAHMNEDHDDAIALYATVLLKRPAGAWRMTGLDPQGIDLAGPDGVARLDFDEPVSDLSGLRRRLADLAKAARNRP